MFVFRLALALGRTVPELLHGMTGPQLGEWLAYFKVRDPEDKADYRTGQMCSAIYATMGVKSQAKDFMPQRKLITHQTRPQQIAALKALTN